MKNTVTLIKKETRYLQLNEITMGKKQFINVVKLELFKFYTHKLTDFDSYSNFEKEKLITLLQNLAYGKYDKIINDKIPNKFPFDNSYNAKIKIEDDYESCGNLVLNIYLKPCWIECLEI